MHKLTDPPPHSCVFESTHLGRFTLTSALSNDSALSFPTASRTNIFSPNTTRLNCAGNSVPVLAGAPQLYAFPQSSSRSKHDSPNVLVLSFMTNESLDSCKGYDGGNLKVMISRDGGRSWGEERWTVSEGPARWGALAPLNGKEFLALWSSKGKGGMGAVARRVALEGL